MPENTPAPAQNTAPLADLLRVAEEARGRSYVPYSKFAMGAAALTDDGSTIAGALVENVSLGLAMCAERVALFATVAQGCRPVALALVARRTDGELTHPCGACLQVALELGGPEMRVVIAEPGGESSESTVGELLPRGPRKR